MKKKTLVKRSVPFGLLLSLVLVIPGWSDGSDTSGVAFTRYKYGAWSSPWCCYTIYAQDYGPDVTVPVSGLHY